MDTSLIRELAELALAGSGQHCHEEALCIASGWSASDRTKRRG